MPCCALVMGQSSKERSYAQDLAVLGLIMGFVRLSAGTEGTSGLDVPLKKKHKNMNVDMVHISLVIYN